MDSNTIMDALKDEIIEHIKSSRSPYTSDIAEVLRGVHGPDDVVNRPLIGITIEKDSIVQHAVSGNNMAEVKVILYCYMDPDGLGEYDKLHQMKKDIRYFLKYDFSHRDNTTVDVFTPGELGSNSSIHYFDLCFRILYQENI